MLHVALLTTILITPPLHVFLRPQLNGSWELDGTNEVGAKIASPRMEKPLQPRLIYVGVQKYKKKQYDQKIE